MGIKAYRPAVSVVVKKLVQRTKQCTAAACSSPVDFDLTPWLSEGGVVRVRKGIREPAGGFTISFSDKISPQTRDTVYAAVEPGDMIEIRAAREAWRFAGQPLPLIMRGYVRNVRRPGAMQSDGTPARSVVITGMDSGRIWQMWRILAPIMWLDDQPYLTEFQAQAVTGIEAKVLPVSTFMEQLTTFVNTKVKALAAYSNHAIASFATNCTVRHGQVAPNVVGPYQGNMWQLAEQFADLPWNELFIEDSEACPTLIFRPKPYHDIKGNLIMQDATEPGTVKADAADIVSMDVSRSDDNIANFFWCAPGYSSLDTSAYANVASIMAGTPLDFKYANNLPALYGIKEMRTATGLMADSLATTPRQSSNEEESGATQVQWHIQRGMQTRDLFRDNGVFEDGHIQMRGDYNLKPGRYLALQQGSIASEYYISAVDHTIQPLRTWTSGLQVERGTGFLVRTQMQGSPYWSEGRKGPYQ